MKISMNWLAEYVSLEDITPEELAERVTLATAEIEGVAVVDNAAGEVLVARVVHVEPAGSAAALVATVDTGRDKVTTVTTAPNVSAGMTTVYAPPGARLPGGVVGVETVHGRSSAGMLCSAGDIGLGERHEGVLECPADAPIGSALSRWVPVRDALFDVDNKSLTHRPDLWGHYGFAREVAAILRRGLRPLPLADLAVGDDLPGFPLRVTVPRDCPRFGVLAVDVAANVPSPLLVQARLHLLGHRTSDALVDATNYVALELGQPTHVYDRTHLADVEVSALSQPAVLTTLDGQVRQLEPGDVAVLSGGRPVAVAGIMGGLFGSTTRGTTQVLLESGNFNPARIRRTAARLRLTTEAGQRFEKHQPPANVVPGLARLVRLLEDAGAEPTLVSRATVVDDGAGDAPPIVMPADYVRRLAGADICDDEVLRTLGYLGFSAEVADGRLTVTVPPFRSSRDISIPADVAEEVLRIHGYGNIAPQPLRAAIEPAPINHALRRQHKARRVLAQLHGYSEIECYPWFDDAWSRRIGFAPGTTLRLRNPVAPEKARLRTTLMPNLLKAVEGNAYTADAFGLFELGRVFVPGEAGAGADPEGHTERVELAGVSVDVIRSGTIEEHYRRAKSAVENLGVALAGSAFTTGTARDDAGTPWQVPGLWAELYSGDERVGRMGLLHGPILDTVAAKRHVAWFELDLTRVGGALYPQPTYRDRSAFPASQQDFSMLWRRVDGYRTLTGLVDRFRHPLVRQREFVTLYEGKGLPEGVGSYTFRFWLQHPDRTLRSEDLDGFREELTSFLAGNGVALR